MIISNAMDMRGLEANIGFRTIRADTGCVIGSASTFAPVNNIAILAVK
jgi:hypothetical protein